MEFNDQHTPNDQDYWSVPELHQNCNDYVPTVENSVCDFEIA